FELTVNNGLASSAPALVTISFVGFGDLPPRSPSDLFKWNSDRGLFVIDYGAGPGTPGDLLTGSAPSFCASASGIFGGAPVSVTLDANGHLVANNEDVLSMQ